MLGRKPMPNSVGAAEGCLLDESSLGGLGPDVGAGFASPDDGLDVSAGLGLGTSFGISFGVSVGCSLGTACGDVVGTLEGDDVMIVGESPSIQLGTLLGMATGGIELGTLLNAAVGCAVLGSTNGA